MLVSLISLDLSDDGCSSFVYISDSFDRRKPATFVFSRNCRDPNLSVLLLHIWHMYVPQSLNGTDCQIYETQTGENRFFKSQA